MTKIKPFIHESFDYKDSEEQEFSSIEELEKVPFVASHLEGHSFHRLSQTFDHKLGQLLIAEYDEGYNYYIVGHLSEAISLPRWEHKVREQT